MAEENDSIIDLTNSYNFALADHNILNNVVINLDTDDSFREDESRQSNNANRRRGGGRKRSHSKSTPGINLGVPVLDLCTPDNNKNKRRSKDFKKESKKMVITEEPEEKKAKTSLGCCPICYDDYCGQALASTKCGHVFCLECLKTALQTEPRCPTCHTPCRQSSVPKRRTMYVQSPSDISERPRCSKTSEHAFIVRTIRACSDIFEHLGRSEISDGTCQFS